MKETERKELVFYRLTKAKETLREIDLLIENKLWNTAINRLYYSCYYAVTGLLISLEIKLKHIRGLGKCLDFIS